MKKSLNILWLVMIIGLVTFVGCEMLQGPAGPAGDVTDANEVCMDCHSGDSAIGNQILVATAQYENSGHFMGPRSGPDVNATHLYMQHGSNANYASGSSCGKCHNHQGFVAEYADGDITGSGGASQIGCFTCHAPHENGDFSLRVEEAVTLADGTTTFDQGAGNLCASCHQGRSTAPSTVTAKTTLTATGNNLPRQEADGTFLVNFSNRGGPHHGPMSDMIMGINAGGDDDYTGVLGAENPHAQTANGCVSCHLYQWDDGERGSVSLGLGGHAFYLQGDVHGSVKDVTGSCDACHDGTGIFAVEGFDAAGADAEADWDGDTVVEDVLAEIAGLKATLLAYYGTGANFYVAGATPNTNTDDGDPATTDVVDYFYEVGAAAGAGPIVAVADGSDITSGVWMVDWEFTGSSVTMTEAQAEGLWSFKYATEDKSGGIHNPRFNAQMLYDAANNLGLTVGTRPLDY